MAVIDNLNNPNVEVHHDTMKLFGWLFIVVSAGLLLVGMAFEVSASSYERVVNLQLMMYKMMLLLGGMASGIAGLMLLIADVIAGKLHRMTPAANLKIKEDPYKDAEVMYEDEEDKDDAPELKPV